MRGSSLHPTDARALDDACRDVEDTVSRIAKVVLHASALADRVDSRAAVQPHSAQRQERLRVLRGAAEAGRRTIEQVQLDLAPGGADVAPPGDERVPADLGQRPRRRPVAPTAAARADLPDDDRARGARPAR